MTTDETIVGGASVEARIQMEPATDGATDSMDGDVVKAEELSTAEVSNVELVAVKAVDGATVATENSSALSPDGISEKPAPKDVKVEAEMQAKEVKKVSEIEGIVIANGNSVPKIEEGADDVSLPLEADHVTILPHWHAKPCVHITGLGGVVTEEDLVPLLSPHGQIVSIVFETERRDSAIVRYEPSGTKGDDVVARVREAFNNTEIKEKSLVVEPFRPDSLLFIGNLTPEIDDTMLRQMFEPHGTVERAFVLRNAEGRSKGYGFVEYGLKAQASAAKLAMGNINMDGRVLRVEWSDCRKISDMFSTVLFVDRISKDFPHIEESLRNLFGQHGKVRDCHLAIGMNQQFRGFGFIDFYHSTSADKAHQALDGHEVQGSNIRVSFANPSKSAQSYKSRFGTQGGQSVTTLTGRGGFHDHMMRPVGPAVVGSAMRGHMTMPLIGSRFLDHGRSNMMGMGIGMQFGRGAPVGPGMIGRSLVQPLIGTGAGMLGPGSVAASMMGRGPNIMLSNIGPRSGISGGFVQQGSRISSGRGPLPINSAAIAQVATAQAKAREEEAKARAEAQAGAKHSAAEQERLEQFRKVGASQTQPASQQVQTYYHQQTQSAGLEQQYKQTVPQFSYKQTYQQSAQQQTTPQAQYQLSAGKPSQQAYSSQYYSPATQQYAQQAQPLQAIQQQQSQPQLQPSQQSQSQQQQQQVQTQQIQQQQQQLLPDQYSQQVYYQQPSQPVVQPAASTQQQYAQYAQQYVQQYGQQQQYTPQYVQTAQQYPQTVQQQAPTQYTQQDYADYYAQQQQALSQQPQIAPTTAAAVVATAVVPAQTPDVAQAQQQQAYAAYYQQRAQEAVAQAGATAVQSSTTAANSQQTLEAQWAAYYAAQAAQQQTTTAATYDQQQAVYAQLQCYATAGSAGYYQQPAAVDIGQKRTADQIDYSAQVGYNYQQQIPTATVSYQQQEGSNGTTAYQQTSTSASAVYQPVSTVVGYQQPASAYQQQAGSGVPYSQQTPTATGYAVSVPGGYQQPVAPVTSLYKQSVAPVAAGYLQAPAAAAAVTSYGQPNHLAVSTPVYDYSKRPRF